MTRKQRRMKAMVLRNCTIAVMAAGLLACSGASAPDGSAAATNATTTVPTASAVQAPAATPAAVPAAPSAIRVETPALSASAAVEPPPPAPSASPAAPPVEEAPLPKVKVKNIGMHIGGGPNDDVTKEPIKRSVEPHFDAFRRCFAKVDDLTKGGDFGVDVLIEGAGGKAKITHPRTALKGEGFDACMVTVFEAIEFLKPKGGKKTMVSYSLRFTP